MKNQWREVLFVGGSADGEFLQIQEALPDIYRLPQVLLHAIEKDNPLPTEEVEFEEYHLVVYLRHIAQPIYYPQPAAFGRYPPIGYRYPVYVLRGYPAEDALKKVRETYE